MGSIVSYVTMVWSVAAASALVLAVLHTLVWVFDRRAYINLLFALVAYGVIGISWVELGMMSAATAAEWGSWVRWFQVPNFCVIVGTVVFVRHYMGTGRLWLMWTLIAARAAILLWGFAVDPNFNFKSIDSIDQIPFLGEEVTVVGRAVAAPWQWIATVATVLSVLYIVDASVSLWRNGTRDARRKALVVGGGIALFFAVAILNTQLIIWGFLERTPTLTAPSFLIALAAMAFEMSRDTLRASRLAQQLLESERALDHAASAAGLGLWSWNAEKNQLWATERARSMFGLNAAGPVDIPRLESVIFNEDLQSIRELLTSPAASGKELELQFRVCAAGASVRWIHARGRWEGGGLIRGVVRDVTDQLHTRQELEELQRNLAHADRVTSLGQLASTLTHELRQPQAAILANVEAAKVLLRDPKPDLQELREILEDIHRDGSRAGEVIDRLRAMMKRRPMEFQPVAVDGLVLDVISLLRSEAVTRGVRLITEIDSGPLVVSGDRVHLTQVLINLILNAMDAVSGAPPARRRVVVQAHATDNEWIEMAVADCGSGISPEVMTKIFEPFFTTKDSGMGMGLSISRTIVVAHGGRLQAENNTEGGATFRLAIRAVQALDA